MPDTTCQLISLTQGGSNHANQLYFPPRLFGEISKRGLPFFHHKISGCNECLLTHRMPDELDGAIVLRFVLHDMINPTKQKVAEFVYRPNTGRAEWYNGVGESAPDIPEWLVEPIGKTSLFFERNPRYRAQWK